MGVRVFLCRRSGNVVVRCRHQHADHVLGTSGAGNSIAWHVLGGNVLHGNIRCVSRCNLGCHQRRHHVTPRRLAWPVRCCGEPHTASGEPPQGRPGRSCRRTRGRSRVREFRTSDNARSFFSMNAGSAPLPARCAETRPGCLNPGIGARRLAHNPFQFKAGSARQRWLRQSLPC